MFSYHTSDSVLFFKPSVEAVTCDPLEVAVAVTEESVSPHPNVFISSLCGYNNNTSSP